MLEIETSKGNSGIISSFFVSLNRYDLVNEKVGILVQF